MAEDHDWIRAVVRQYEGPLTIYATRLLGDVDRARDVVQDTFLKLWQADRGAIEGHLARWLYAVCRNRAIDGGRKEQRMTRLGDQPVESETTARPSSSETAPVLDVIEGLSERQQEALRLKFQGGLSYREIAEVMDTTANNVGVMLHTAIKNIRTRLAERSSSDATPGSITG